MQYDGREYINIRIFLVIIDDLNSELKKRILVYEKVSEKFFLFLNFIKL